MSVQVVTDYDIFEKIKDGLLVQGCKSVMRNGDCSYRGLSESTYEAIEAKVTAEVIEDSVYEDLNDYQMSDSYFDNINDRINSYIEHMPDDDNRLKKCAIGQIISGRYYSAGLEGVNIDDGLVWDAICNSNPNWSPNHESRVMLTLVQRIHDTSPVENWEVTFNKMQQYFTAESMFDLDRLVLDSSKSAMKRSGKIDASIEENYTTYSKNKVYSFLPYLFDFISRED